MPSLSKFQFENIFSQRNCHILHPWAKQCTEAHVIMMKSCFVGSIKYYGILYLISALLKYRKWNKKYFQDNALCFSKTVTAVTLIGPTFMTFACFLRYLQGRFYYNTVTFVPGCVAGLWIFIISQQKRSVISQVFLQLVIEAFVHVIENTGCAVKYTVTNTLGFMILNAYLLYLLRLEANKDASKRKYPIWIFHPPASIKSSPDNPCPHKDDCLNYIYQGVSTYFKYGCAVELCKLIAKNFGKIKSSPLTLPSLLLKLNIKAGLFAGGYVGIYRAITCYLCQKYRKDDPKYALVGGFLCGAVYPFYPLFNLITTVISSSIFVHVWKLEEQVKIPIMELLFSICLGYLLYLRFLTPELSPYTANQLLSSVTNGKVDVIWNNIYSLASEVLKSL